ncbi:hypothetical protein GFD22_00700 [Bifidobacterium avesanii]|uniref:Uncharacterized protein n=2 Tax=Bifidobacterium avesanii TaxID=1798157 RepID=A0A7K3TF36_9BIFI|nr:hypothetical protein [Bifidobacterium avesanii]
MHNEPIDEPITRSCGGTTISLDPATLALTVERGGHVWRTAAGVEPTIELDDDAHTRIPFARAASISHETRSFGTGEGIVSHFARIPGLPGLAFDAFVWVEASGGDVIAEWIPTVECEAYPAPITAVRWPVPFAFDEPRADWGTLITHCQGTLIPNDWPNATGPIPFNGRFGTEGGYMPFLAQLRGGALKTDGRADALLTICETPWNAGYEIDHPAGGPYTHAGVWFEPSLGRMDYRRVLRLRVLEGDWATVTGAAKAYRRYAAEHGNLRTLREKAAANPSVNDLAGAMWVHVGAKTVVQPDSRFWDAEHPENNHGLTTFAQRAKELEVLHGFGVEKLYMHLDGWGQPGYDNAHPDYTPACAEAGGWAGLKALADTAHRLGYRFGLHDQYRDYYYTAASHDLANAVMLPDGSFPEHALWAGGRQNYLCAELAPDYVKRNYREIAANGVELDGTYLDVFTCNEGDECANPAHRMTRRDCLAKRAECFDWLLAQGILTSSEEVSDWAVPSLVFCHYAPYDFQMRRPGEPRDGVPVPLQNLVYHDCVIEPWMMDRVEGGEDYMPYALLNGGAPYLIRDAAYAGFDGDIDDAKVAELRESIERCREVARLHERVAMEEMTGFAFVDGDPNVQRTEFADGTAVTADLADGTWRVDYGKR